jgi:AbrB family looped-hinge helix DNA binding protein
MQGCKVRCVDQQREKENTEEKTAHPPVLVKGYMRPDGTSYYVVIPKEIRTILNLKGGEYFIMKAVPEKGMVKLKMVYFADEEGEGP